jgi:hypothetical protein
MKGRDEMRLGPDVTHTFPLPISLLLGQWSIHTHMRILIPLYWLYA